MKITIKRVGNRSLYRSLYEEIDCTSNHRTTSGAARRLIELARDGKKWAKSVGKWGHIEIEVNGLAIDKDDVASLCYDAQDVVESRPQDASYAESRLKKGLADLLTGS